MSKNYAIIIQFVLPLTPFYRSGARRRDVYKRDAFVTTWRFHNRAWQPERRDRLPETSGTLWIHRGALTNQRCSLATGCGISEGNPPVTGGFSSQRSLTQSFDVFFDLRLNKLLKKQLKRWCFETPSRSLWRHCNGIVYSSQWETLS